MKVQVRNTVQLFSFFNFGAKWEWVINATLRPIYSWETDPLPILQVAGWPTPRPASADGQNLAPTGIRPQDRLTVNREIYSVFVVQMLSSNNLKKKTLDPSSITFLPTTLKNKTGKDTNLYNKIQ